MPKTRKNRKQKGSGCTALRAIVGNKTIDFKPPKNDGTFVGDSWSGAPKNWPGCAGIDGTTNYLAENQYLVDPQRNVVSSHFEDVPPTNSGPSGYFHIHSHYHPRNKVGGKKKKRKTRRGKKRGKKTHKRQRQRGGFNGKNTLFPQDLVNIFRTLGFGASSLIDGVMGNPTGLSPMPVDQSIDKTTCPPYNIPPNIKKLNALAQKKVIDL